MKSFLLSLVLSLMLLVACGRQKGEIASTPVSSDSLATSLFLSPGQKFVGFSFDKHFGHFFISTRSRKSGENLDTTRIYLYDGGVDSLHNYKYYRTLEYIVIEQ